LASSGFGGACANLSTGSPLGSPLATSIATSGTDAETIVTAMRICPTLRMRFFPKSLP
jgi:hypothetical protein